MEEASPTRIEGMAAWGLIKSIRVEECSSGRTARVVAGSKDGRMLATECMEKDAARRVATVVRLYLKNWANLITEASSHTPQ